MYTSMPNHARAGFAPSLERRARCGNCNYSTTIAGEDPALPAENVAAAQHGWNWDHDTQDEPVALCPDCVVRVTAKRTAATRCPEWCNECSGYDLNIPGTRHSRVWRLGGEVVAEVTQYVGLDGSVREFTASLEEGEFMTLENLRELARIAAEVADLLGRFDLTP